MANSELEYGLQQLLVADEGIAALLGTRIYPLLLPDQPTFPSATYQRVSTVTIHGLSDNFSFTKCRLQIDTWDLTFPGARAVATAIAEVLEGYADTLSNGVAVRDVVLDSQIDLYDSAARLFRVSLDFIVLFSRP